MSGVTPHGIRHPDGASKAKNLGPELKTMAEDIDHVFTDTLEGGVIYELVEGIAEEAVDDKIEEVGLIVGIPLDERNPSSRLSLPVGWTNKVLNDPYPATYQDSYGGAWENTLNYVKEVPFLDNNTGRVPEALISDRIARLTDLPVIPKSIPAERMVRARFPVFAARVARAVSLGTSAAMVCVGSSTTNRNPGYVGRLTELLQRLYPVESPSPAQWSPTANFTRLTAPGLHGYSAGKSGGVTSADYLTDAECDRIAELQPAFILHMVFANDHTDQVPPATAEANLQARVARIDSVLTAPCQHIFVHSYERLNFTPAQYTWDEYREAMQRVADNTPTGVLIDLSPAYIANGVPGADPLELISTDDVHQNRQGYRLMEDLLATEITG